MNGYITNFNWNKKMTDSRKMEIMYKVLKFVLFFLVVDIISETNKVSGENRDFSQSGGINDAALLDSMYQAETFTSTAPYYYDHYNPQEIFKLGSDYCNDKSSCSDMMYLTFPDKLCHCDKLCELMSDCCSNYGTQSIAYLTYDQFKCVLSPEIVKNAEYGVSMVTKCSKEWTDMYTRELCEANPNGTDILLKLPVSEKTEFHRMFRNMYCAQCNYVNDYYFWKQEIQCRNETGVRSLPEMTDCVNHFIRPIPEVLYRTCQLSLSIISSCDESAELTSYNLMKDCTDGVYAITFDESGFMYRNKYCAICNGVSEDKLFCEQLNVIPVTDNPVLSSGQRAPYSLRLIVDFNTGIADTTNWVTLEGKSCKDSEIYDWLSKRCRGIYCAPPLVPINGSCSNNVSNIVNIAGQPHQPIVQQENCTWVQVDSQEYMFTNNSELFVISHQRIYSSEEYLLKGADVLICLNKTETCINNCNIVKTLYYSDIVESYLTLVGLIVSILSLIVTLIVYVAFPQMLNTPGKILASLIISLLFAQILFLIAPDAINISSLCTLLAILVHYFFLAAFCWMNVIAFDLWMTFSNRFMTPGSDSKGRKRFTRYSLYAWLLPVIIVCAAIVVDFVDFDGKFVSLKPGYGKSVCWISSRNALILFFAGPLAVFKIFDITSFISTAVHIARAKKEGAMATRRRNTCSFIINIKLSLIMGLTWVFAFVANATNENVLWYFFIIFNSLQGLFIAICYLCTKKVGRLLNDKYKQVTTRYASSTQITSVP